MVFRSQVGGEQGDWYVVWSGPGWRYRWVGGSPNTLWLDGAMSLRGGLCSALGTAYIWNAGLPHGCKVEELVVNTGKLACVLL